MTEIRELDQATVERIAAGEVVERPASAVKELVENSLDAGAERIEVAVESGGTDRLSVSDDGVGMTEPQLRRAVEQHTTSKITDIADLEGGVGSLGFRGEALHAIGAVSRLTITSRPHPERHGTDAACGTKLTVEGSEVTGVEPAGCPAGTTVEVRDLFYNVPARRKYLNRESTEFAHVTTTVRSYALANPDVAVSLSHDGRETFATPGRGDRRETVMAVYGRDVAESMVAVDGAALPEGPLDGIAGLVSHPETNRASREYLSTFVNGRYVTASAVRDAVVDAYDTQLAPDRYPFAVVDLSVDPAAVDVNVHPRKLEVRFADTEAIPSQVRTTIEETLLAEGLVRSSAPRGQSAPDQTEIDPGTRSEDRTGSDTGHGDPGDTTGTDTDNGGSGDAAEIDAGTQAGGARSGDSGSSSDGTATAPGRDRSRRSSPDAGGGTARDAGSGASRDADGTGSGDGAGPTTGSGDGTEQAGQSAEHTTGGRKFGSGGEQTRLGEDGTAGVCEYDRLPAMRVLGQFQDTYVVAETDDGLVLIDQHAADERINYERLREALDGDTETQALAEPVELSLTAGEAELFETHTDALARLGFRAERVGDRTVELRTVPALAAGPATPELLRDVLGEFVAGEDAAAATVEAAADDLLADLACYPSITGNTSLTEGSVVNLLAALDDCENPYACPHGRPVLIELDGDELAARFERDYPGHGG
jgi:DNA mismatch repair protein MutL